MKEGNTEIISWPKLQRDASYIEYIYICKRQDPLDFVIPKEFEYNIFDIIKELPKAVRQLNQTLEFFYANLIFNDFQGYNFNIIFEDNSDMWSTSILKSFCKIFLLDYRMDSLYDLLKEISSQSVNSLIGIVNANEEEVKKEKKLFPFVFTDAGECLLKLRTIVPALELEIQKLIPGFQMFLSPNEEPSPIKKLPFRGFKPSWNNYFILNQMTGFYWNAYDAITQSKKFKSDSWLRKESAASDRQLILLEQIRLLDEIYSEGPIESELTPLILICPYQYPKFKERFGDNLSSDQKKIVTKVFSVEQNIDYRNIHEKPPNENEMNLIYSSLKLQSERTHFLDGIGYLHASFKNSPVIRTPLLSNSIKKELSFFRPEMVANPQKLKDALSIIGVKLNELLFKQEISEYLKSRNGQIVAITDLPIEWLIMDKLPLHLTHDITRIPELNFRSSLNTYVFNSSSPYVVTTNILEKTLIIVGFNENEDNDRYFPYSESFLEESKTNHGITFKHCKNKTEAINCIREFKPQLLIFDCHGDYDEETGETFLWIGNEKLKDNDIIDNEISAPIVFISACNTAPNYGYYNTIVGAFFQVGTYCVTATYLPIGLYTGSILYQRLIGNLSQKSNSIIHKSWLHYISYLNRTSITSDLMIQALRQVEYYYRALPDKKDAVIEDICSVCSKINSELLYHSSRVDTFNNMVDRINAIDKCINVSINRANVDHYFYTTFGRADLILFEEWLKKRKLIMSDQKDIPNS